MKRLILATALVASAAACSLPFIGGTRADDHAGSRVGGDPAAELPIVQVRDYWRASAVDVVAWDPADPAVGLRTSVTRTGDLAGGVQPGDHRLYMTPLYARDMGGFSHSFVIADRPLLSTGMHRDIYSCHYGDRCSPMVTIGVRIPDPVLRANRDSLVVNFTPGAWEAWKITLRRELIDAYLGKVDSLVAQTRSAR